MIFDDTVNILCLSNTWEVLDLDVTNSTKGQCILDPYELKSRELDMSIIESNCKLSTKK